MIDMIPVKIEDTNIEVLAMIVKQHLGNSTVRWISTFKMETEKQNSLVMIF